ncbi:DEAD/DEAH box helicase [Salinibacterium sp. ZJ454]|uniref:DEAD/DEAH box helicase n=1 Tax=Salinibacterium sp. ZJ454 TaxID=2708339 RepID=UPI00141EC658|nr:DEAD/DEAH box helicase [Salinibacterium sp. ZJ454]
MSRSAQWVLTEDSTAIALVSADGTELPASGLDIFDAEFGGSQILRNCVVEPPSRQLTTIRFNPATAPLTLKMIAGREGSVVLVLGLPSSEWALAAWPEADQLIADRDWYAVDLSMVAGWRDRLREGSIELGVPLNARELLWLLWESGLAIESKLPTDAFQVLRIPDGAAVFDDLYLRADLYPYQVAGAEFLARMYDLGVGALLADEMGLGKTMQALYLLVHASQRSAEPSLVVVPASTLANWEREIARFAPALSVRVHAGPRRTGNPRALIAANVVLTSTEVLVRDRYLLDSVQWGAVVVDEAQNIKNASSQRSQAAKSLTARCAVAVTGTPIENSLKDMWSIFEFVAPEYLGSLENFIEQFPDEVEAALELSHRVAPMTIRRSVSKVAQDLPPRVDIVTPIYAGDRFASQYEDFRRDSDEPPITQLLRLRQLCASPQSVVESWASISKDFAKYDRLVEILDEVAANGGKALIFASFIDAIDELFDCIRERFPTLLSARVDGRSSPSDRQGIIDGFNGHPDSAFLIMNPRAAGVGLNIQAANYVIHYTPEWNPAVVAQASARAHRRGQTRPVFVYYLYYVGTVEEVMMDRLSAKRELQEAGLSAISPEPSSSDVLAALGASPLTSGGQ